VPFCQVILRAQKPQLESNNHYPKNLSTLGDHIRKRRLELKLTAKEVGKRLGVDMYTVYEWEHHTTNPNPRRLQQIIEFLGYEPDIQFRQFYGEKLLAYRKSHGLYQRQLAQILGVSKTTLQQWESNKRCPSKEFLEKLFFVLEKTSQEIPE
jgi:transcriptional regulator with XRE-family HTH domain